MTQAAPAYDRVGIVRAFDVQARACDALGSPLTAFLLRGVIADYQAGGASRDLLAPLESRQQWEAVTSLRLAGALHFLVLAGRTPGLAAYYPSAGGTFREDGFRAEMERAMRGEAGFIEAFIRRAPQTNEVRRTGALVGGFLIIAARTGLPLRCLEVGASAGLNLHWDRFRYDFAGAAWGDRASPVTIGTAWTGDAPETGVSARVIERAGCDINPIDLSSAEAVLRLKSYVWPDHPGRFRILERATDLARRHPVALETADAADWTARHLAEPRPGVATVVFHSIAAQYFSDGTRAAFEAAIRDAGHRASGAAPVAWLRMEQASPVQLPEIRLTIWPGGHDLLLGHAHPHGLFAHWMPRS
ncbi:DUF2332 domain-containing protein [Emcibacter sp. SYSU 3D8]|uniref:DUF2332 domain-containing protein n=1 Tax=Emcibacter sp. SYSU 3D8 TaxID=3133969 RepID=UPI0031FECE24